jgi:KaiC/GvpD/RAD55 family RecA-like ATPase
MEEELINQKLLNVLNKHSSGVVVMSELSTENYFVEILSSVKKLVDNYYEGVFISFQRPFSNLESLFKRFNIDYSKLFVIDVASSFASQESVSNPNVVSISQDVDVDDLIRSIYMAISKINTYKKFIFIDSISTLTLHKPLSETLRFSEFLIRTVNQSSKTDETISLIINVSKDLVQKKFIKDIALRVNEVIR